MKKQKKAPVKKQIKKKLSNMSGSSSSEIASGEGSLKKSMEIGSLSSDKKSL